MTIQWKGIQITVMLCATLLLASCGGGGGSDPEPVAVPTPTPTTLTWDNGNWDEVEWQ